jgi:hypothetical protein
MNRKMRQQDVEDEIWRLIERFDRDSKYGFEGMTAPQVLRTDLGKTIRKAAGDVFALLPHDLKE